MQYDALKLELIEWLTHLDASTLDFLKLIKESQKNNEDWWSDLSAEQQKGIERGLQDIQMGKVTPHSEISSKYGI
jgi:hypothetical protein